MKSSTADHIRGGFRRGKIVVRKNKYSAHVLRLLYNGQANVWGTAIPVIFTPSPLVSYTNQGKEVNRIKGFFLALLVLLAGLLHPLATGIDAREVVYLTSLRSQYDVHSRPTLPTNQGWTYYKSFDPSKGFVRWAEVPSINSLSFDFPYNSGLVGYFSIPKKSQGAGLVLRLEKGLFEAKAIDGKSVRIHLDNRPAQLFSIQHDSVFVRNTVSIQTTPTFIEALKRAKKMRVEIHFYNERLKELEFNVQGLKRSF